MNDDHQSAPPAAPKPGEAEFDNWAADYDVQCMKGLALSGESRDYFAVERAKYLARWWERTQRQPPEQIIDYGCGDGAGTDVLAKAFPRAEIRGVDLSKRSIEAARTARRDARIEFLDDQDHLAKPFEACLLHFSGVLHHVSPNERDSLLRSQTAMLRVGGTAVVFENNPLNPGTRWIMARIPFDRDAVTLTAREAAARLRRQGLSIEHQTFLFWFPGALRWLRPLERYMCWIPFAAQYGVFASRRR
ncbi:MAG: class I SAM-dependent methyltransferase [Pseudomonadota bacterium]